MKELQQPQQHLIRQLGLQRRQSDLLQLPHRHALAPGGAPEPPGAAVPRDEKRGAGPEHHLRLVRPRTDPADADGTAAAHHEHGPRPPPQSGARGGRAGRRARERGPDHEPARGVQRRVDPLRHRAVREAPVDGQAPQRGSDAVDVLRKARRGGGGRRGVRAQERVHRLQSAEGGAQSGRRRSRGGGGGGGADKVGGNEGGGGGQWGKRREKFLGHF